MLYGTVTVTVARLRGLVPQDALGVDARVLRCSAAHNDVTVHTARVLASVPIRLADTCPTGLGTSLDVFLPRGT